MPLEYALQLKKYSEAADPWRKPIPKPIQLLQELGIADLPIQQYERNKHRPFMFNVMVCGQSGLGKTTFMNTLFNSDLNEEISPRYPKSTVSIEKRMFELEENGVKLDLSYIDTPGFGDAVNRSTSFEPILQYIDKQFQEHLTEEKRKDFRKHYADMRVHCVLYFIGNGGLKQLDVEFLKAITEKVNVIPLLAKADGYTFEERNEWKQRIMETANRHGISFYPVCYSQDRDAIGDAEKWIPYAVIGSDQIVNYGGKNIRVRKYKWGQVDVNTTATIHYAKYRASELRPFNKTFSILPVDDEYYEQLAVLRNSEDDMQRKEEELRQSFICQVREAEKELRQKEESLLNKSKEMSQKLEEEKSMLDQAMREVDALLLEKSSSSSKSKLFRK